MLVPHLERGRYSTYLPAWMSAFPKGMHVVYLQDLLDKKQTLANVYAHLGIDAGFAPGCWGPPVNQSADPRTRAVPCTRRGAPRLLRGQ